MSKNAGIAFCCLMAMLAFPGADKKTKPPAQKPVATMAAPAQLFLPPTITRAACKCLAGGGQFEVNGKMFGASQGNRVLRINQIALPTVLTWRNDLIRCSHAWEFPGGEDIQVDIFDAAQNKRVSNLFAYLSPICIYELDPAGALKPKSRVTLLVKQAVGSTAAGRKVMIGDQEVPADWMVRKIVIVVPIMAAGDYTLRLEKNGQLISNEIEVSVHD